MKDAELRRVSREDPWAAGVLGKRLFRKCEESESRREDREIIRLLRRSQTAGDVDASGYLAYMKMYGYGMEPDWEAGRKELEGAADGGSPFACKKLGNFILWNTFGEGKDPDRAIELIGRAAELGDSEAFRWLGGIAATSYHGRENLEASRGWYILGAESGDLESMEELARYLATGIGGPKDHAGAARWFEKLHDSGRPYWTYRLGQALLLGRGVEVDTARGLSLLMEAAGKEVIPAQRDLGWFFSEGMHGVPVDPDLAFHFTFQAAEAGNTWSRWWLGHLYKLGVGTQPDAVKAFECFRRASVDGQAEAMSDLAWCYQYGKGTHRNLEKAEWWRKQARRHNSRWDAFKRDETESRDDDR